MKNTIIAASLILGLLSPTLSVAAATAPKTPISAAEKKLQTKLLQISAKQKTTKAKLKTNVVQVKAVVKKVKKQRVVVKQKRAAVHKKVQPKVSATVVK